MIQHTNYHDIPMNLNAHGIDARRLFSDEALNIIHLELKPGDFIPLHGKEVDVKFFVVEGEGSFISEEGNINLKEGSLVHSPKGSGIGWENNSNQKLRLLGFKSLI